MSCTDFRDRLDDFVDGELSPDSAEEAARHLEGCESCRAEERELRAVLARASSLAGEVTPQRDLWPEIRDRIEGRGVEAFFEVGSWATWRTAAAVAASLLVVVTTAVVAYRLGQGSSIPSALPTTRTSGTAVLAVDAEFMKARGELRVWLAENRESLPPETLQRVDRSLGVIDDSIAEIRAALDENPTSPELNRLLLATYRREVRLLQRVNAWSTRL